MLAACRSTTPELAGLAGVGVIDGVDVSAPDATTRVKTALGTETVDVVICNAGINESFAESIADVDAGALDREFQVNALGAVRTVQATVGHLEAGAKIALISSGVVNPYAPGRRTPAMYGYKMSKAALNEFAIALANELRARGIIVMVLDPGPMDTALLRRVFDAGCTSFDPRRDGQDSDVVARALLGQIEVATLESSGRWFSADGGELEL